MTTHATEDKAGGKSVEGICHDRKIEFLGPPPEGAAGRAIVTFLLPAHSIDLHERGIDEKQACDLRARLSAFAEDWERPEMDVYNAL